MTSPEPCDLKADISEARDASDAHPAVVDRPSRLLDAAIANLEAGPASCPVAGVESARTLLPRGD